MYVLNIEHQFRQCRTNERAACLLMFIFHWYFEHIHTHTIEIIQLFFRIRNNCPQERPNQSWPKCMSTEKKFSFYILFIPWVRRTENDHAVKYFEYNTDVGIHNNPFMFWPFDTKSISPLAAHKRFNTGTQWAVSRLQTLSLEPNWRAHTNMNKKKKKKAFIEIANWNIRCGTLKLEKIACFYFISV